MASARRLAGVMAAASLANAAVHASDVGSLRDYSAPPAGYSLFFDKDRATSGFSVFQLSIAEDFGVIGSGFAASADPRLKPLTRLDSSWSLNGPLRSLPLRLGDGVSSVGIWDQPARIGGIQIGSLQVTPPEVLEPPTQIALPYAALGPVGMASPRFIDHLHGLIHPQNQSLASAGQSDFSMEAGRLREQFEVRSNDYGPWIASGTYRYGANTATTMDGEVAQVAGQQSYVGLGVLEGFGRSGLVSARVASSRDQDATGWLARMGFDYSREGLSISVSSHIQSATFQQVGDTAVIESMRQRTLASAGLDLGALGKISVASAKQTYNDDSRRDILALSHAVPFGGGGIVSTAAAYSPGVLGSSALLLSFTYPFDYLAAPVRRVNGAVDSALNRTIAEAFAQGRTIGNGRLSIDRAGPP